MPAMAGWDNSGSGEKRSRAMRELPTSSLTCAQGRKHRMSTNRISLHSLRPLSQHAAGLAISYTAIAKPHLNNGKLRDFKRRQLPRRDSTEPRQLHGKAPMGHSGVKAVERANGKSESLTKQVLTQNALVCVAGQGCTKGLASTCWSSALMYPPARTHTATRLGMAARAMRCKAMMSSSWPS